MNIHEYPISSKLTNPLYIVCGPTATGKSVYALKLAKKINGELISVDSRQVYKYLDIGTGKDIPKKSKFINQNLKFQNITKNYSVGFYEFNKIPLWLYDVVTPDQQFSAFEHAKVAQDVIQDIWNRGKKAILVGGTGLYIKAAVDGFDISAPPDWKLRKNLNNKTVEQLQNRLVLINVYKFQSMNNSDKNNPHRLIRAIEIEKFKGKASQKTLEPIKQQWFKQLKPVFIGLTFPIDKLYKKIDYRIENRIKQGMLDEIKSVLENGYSWNNPGLNTLGYKQLKSYFENTETLEEAVKKWKLAEHAYARRQLTWFNKDKRITWIHGK